MDKKIEVNIPNRVFYSILFLIGLVFVVSGVYAYTTGTAVPSVMGHTFNEIATPTGCSTGQYLVKTSTTAGWACATPTSYSPTVTCSGTNKGLQWTGSAWVCATYTSSTATTCTWSGWNYPCGEDLEYPFGTTCTEGYTGIKAYCSGGYITESNKITCCPTSLSY